MRFGLNRLAQPRFDLVPAHLGDGVTLAFGPGTGLHLTGEDLPVARQTTERGVDLAERERLAPPEIAVVIALQVVAVAGLSIEQAEEGKGDTHNCEHTLSVYTRATVELRFRGPSERGSALPCFLRRSGRCRSSVLTVGDRSSGRGQSRVGRWISRRGPGRYFERH